MLVDGVKLLCQKSSRGFSPMIPKGSRTSIQDTKQHLATGNRSVGKSTLTTRPPQLGLKNRTLPVRNRKPVAWCELGKYKTWNPKPPEIFQLLSRSWPAQGTAMAEKHLEW